MELATALSVSYRSIDVASRRENFPKRDIAKKYDTIAVCEWVVNSSQRKSKMWHSAKSILANYRKLSTIAKNVKKVSLPAPSAAALSSSKKQTAEGVPVKVSIPNPDNPDDTGDFADILDKFRYAVNYYADKWQDASVDSEDEDKASILIRNWSQAFDQLRKSEESVIAIKKQRGDLLPKEDVIAAFVSMATSIKSNLLIIPSKISHELLNQSKPGTVQKILEDELHDALDALTRNPFGSNK